MHFLRLTSFVYGMLILIVDSLYVTMLLFDDDPKGATKFHRVYQRLYQD